MPDLMPVPMQQCKRLDELSVEVGAYVVSRMPHDDPEDWHCTCKSFRYERGLDEMGRCKHIRQHLEERCTWHEMYGAAQDDNQKQHMSCPECGGGTMWISVGV